MRFEIRTGGIAGILLGVLVLSVAVFVMGLLAGYDIGHESQVDTQQVAVNYPLPPARSSGQGPAASTAPVAPPLAPGVAHATSMGGNPKAQVANAAKRPIPAEADGDNESNGITEAGTGPHPLTRPPAKRVVSAETPAVAHNTRHKPFNIQIEAAMDQTSAQDMARRLGALGYQPHLLPTEINGSTWYKVEVGPYTTQEEAADAEVELRRKYNATYGRGGAPAQPSDEDQGPEE
jgi:septal ring-binding cell division protein DamX